MRGRLVGGRNPFRQKKKIPGCLAEDSISEGRQYASTWGYRLTIPCHHSVRVGGRIAPGKMHRQEAHNPIASMPGKLMLLSLAVSRFPCFASRPWSLAHGHRSGFCKIPGHSARATSRIARSLRCLWRAPLDSAANAGGVRRRKEQGQHQKAPHGVVVDWCGTALPSRGGVPCSTLVLVRAFSTPPRRVVVSVGVNE